MPQSARITANTLALSFQTPPAIALIFTDNKHKKRRVRRFQIPLTGDDADDIYKSLASSFPQYLGPSVVPAAQLTRLIQRLLNRFRVDGDFDDDNISAAEHNSLYSAPEPPSPLSNQPSSSSSLPPINATAKPSAIPSIDTNSQHGSEAPDTDANTNTNTNTNADANSNSNPSANDDELMALLSDLETRTSATGRSRNKSAAKSQTLAASSALSSLPPFAPSSSASASAPSASIAPAATPSPAPALSTPLNPRLAAIGSIGAGSSLPTPTPTPTLSAPSSLGPLSSLPPLAGRPKLSSLPPLSSGPALNKLTELPKPVSAPVTQVFIPTSTVNEEDLNRVSPRSLAAKKAEMERAFKANQVTKASNDFVYDKRADFGPAKAKSEWDDDAEEDVEAVDVSVPTVPAKAPVTMTSAPAPKVEEPVDLDIAEDLDIEVDDEEEEEEQPQSKTLDKKEVPSPSAKAPNSVLSSLLGLPIIDGLKVIRNSDDGLGDDSDENAENDILF